MTTQAADAEAEGDVISARGFSRDGHSLEVITRRLPGGLMAIDVEGKDIDPKALSGLKSYFPGALMGQASLGGGVVRYRFLHRERAK